MTRNDMISALIRAIGVAILALAFVALLEFLLDFMGHVYQSVRVTIKYSFEQGYESFPLGRVISTFIVVLFRIVLGYSLMGGGKWFYAKATAKE